MLYVYIVFILQFEYEEVDISKEENHQWFKLYRYDIPVVHLNGKLLMKHHIDVSVLQKALSDLNSDDSRTT